ncbi:hypothetical protein [Sphingomonas piscis]|uniref:hypothetical protein n=1 Tax=Sphingomonas piscis TaxID=2714943 RepID=UPI0019D03E76|nr:hypothetical protein [Sphingomonas piscis]
MKRLGLTAAIAASVAVTGCASNPYGYNGYGNRASDGQVATGAAVGAGVGALAGAVLPGVKPITGAIAGGIAGAVLGATVNGRQYYRDTSGNCYYVDQYGRPHYNYNVRC